MRKHNQTLTSEERLHLAEQEHLIADATELICELLKRKGTNRQQLAERLGKSKGHVTQLLSGERNMTLRTLADVAAALGNRFELRTAALSAPRTYGGRREVPRLAYPQPLHFERSWEPLVRLYGQSEAHAAIFRSRADIRSALEEAADAAEPSPEQDEAVSSEEEHRKRHEYALVA